MTLASFLRDLPNRYGRVTNSGTYVPQIDGMRFLAIVQVMIFHASFRGIRSETSVSDAMHGLYAYLPNGAAGVELFFFISGYIISYPFLAGRVPRLSSFYLRRLYRLEPPYFLILILCFLVLSIGAHGLGAAPQFEKSDVPLPLSFLASCFYLHDLIFQAPPRLNPPLWSLELEIQFYLLAPLLLLFYRRIGGYRTRMGVGFLLVLTALVLQVAVGRVLPFYHFTIFGNCYAFLLGIVLCDMAVETNPFGREPTRSHDLIFVLGALLILISSIVWLPWRGNFLLDIITLVMRAVGIALLYLGASRGKSARRFLALPWLTFIGGACYSLYLVHVPLMQATGNFIFHHVHTGNPWVSAALAVLLLLPPALFAGMLYYLLVERPCMERNWPQKLWARLARKGPTAVPSSIQIEPTDFVDKPSQNLG